MDWLKKAPTSLVVTVAVMLGIATVAYLGGYVFLLSNGIDTTEYRALLNTAFNYLGLLVGGTAAVGSVAAARSANKAEQNTNGHLTDRDARIEEQAAQIEQLKAEIASKRPTNGGPA
jgi:hypothetical protein